LAIIVGMFGVIGKWVKIIFLFQITIDYGSDTDIDMDWTPISETPNTVGGPSVGSQEAEPGVYDDLSHTDSTQQPDGPKSGYSLKNEHN